MVFVAGAAAYDTANFELVSRAKRYESSAFGMSGWAGQASGGNVGPFLDPATDSVDRCIAALAAAAADLRRLAGICGTRADLVRGHIQQVRWYHQAVARTPEGEPLPNPPVWSYSWNWS